MSIFEKIVSKEIKSNIVYEDDYTIAFLDISPISKGHTLVIPKKCTELIYDIEDSVLAKVIVSVKKVCNALKKTFPDLIGVNIINNNEKGAGQIVPHLHFHCIPRFKDDNISFLQKRKDFSEKEMSEIKNKIINSL